MLGWMVIVAQQTPEQRAASDKDDPRDRKPELARWETGVNGTDWLDKLVEAGKAECIGGHCGYPMRYVSKARDVLPLITDKPPAYQGIARHESQMPWVSDVEIHQKKIAACPPDAVLTIDKWDLS